jgi:outer membrane protein
MTRMRFPALLGLAMLAAPALHAQTQPQDSTPLSLDQALRTAQENNPTYRRALTEVGTSEAGIRRARGAFLPTASLRIAAGGSYSRVATGEGQFGEPVERPELQAFQSSNTSQTLSLGSLPLFDAGARLRDLRAAREAAGATQARVGATEITVRADVSRRYWETVRADRLIRLEEELLASARDRLEVTRALLRVGVRGPLDVLGAEVTVAEQEQALELAHGNARKAQLDLRQAMGVIQDGWLKPTDEPIAMFDPAATLNADALVQQAMAGHPRIARVQALQRQSEHQVASARAARWPRFSVGASLGRSQRFSNYSGFVQPNPRDQSLGLNFDLSIPLFTGHQTSYQIQSARAARDAAGEDARAERLALERDVRGAVVDLDNAYRAAVNAERTLTLNRRRLELAQQQYRVGALTLTDLTDAVERAARAERDAIRTRFDFATAHATLEERLGAPVRP